jgi:hypothetical protein
MRIVAVSICLFSPDVDWLKGYRIELAVSLNSHEAQILNRQANEWVSSVTLSEVSLLKGGHPIQP